MLFSVCATRREHMKVTFVKLNEIRHCITVSSRLLSKFAINVAKITRCDKLVLQTVVKRASA